MTGMFSPELMMASRQIPAPSIGRTMPTQEAGFMRWLSQQPNHKLQTSGRNLNKGDTIAPRAKWDVGGHTPAVQGPAIPYGINPMYSME